MIATVIGLGSMGWGAAASLIRAGIAVHGVDVRPEALARLQAQGGTGHATPAPAAALSDVVLVFVVNASQAETVLFGPQGAIGTARPGTVFLLCVTMPPTAAIDLGTRLAAAEMLALDAPVSGGAAKALAGAMTLMASGPPEAFARAAPVIAAISAKVFRLGDHPGPGSQVKMINQLLAGVHIAAMGEAMALAAGIGLDLATVHEVITASAGNSWMFENRGAHVVAGDYAVRSAVDIFVKDLGIVAAEAADAGMKTPLTETALGLFQEAAAAGMGRQDDASVALILARKGGVRLPGDQ